MTDTQWPRYEVFKQDKPQRPHEAIGTVHAPDGEIALQNARDVHVRRPDCHSLWVARESAIYKVTAEQLAQHPPTSSAQVEGAATNETYQVFSKSTLRRSMVSVSRVGKVVATTAEEALAAAVGNPEWNDGEIYLWWIVPDRAIIRSQTEDILSMFEPATRKTYKQQSRYGLVERKAQSDKTLSRES